MALRRQRKRENYLKMETVIGMILTSQGMPRTDARHQKLEKKLGSDSPSEPPGGCNFGNNLISDFQATTTVREQLCYLW